MKGTLPNGTIKNFKKDAHYMTIAIRKGRVLENVRIEPKKVMNDQKEDGVKLSIPIPSCEDNNNVNGENPCVEEEKKYTLLSGY